MIDTFKIVKMFPLYTTGGYTVSVMSSSDVEWYADCMISDYYNMYNSADFRKIDSDRMIRILNALTGYYKEGSQKSNMEVRFIVHDKDMCKVGGGSLFYSNHRMEMLISYFIVPEKQNKGICTDVLKCITKAIDNYFDEHFNCVIDIHIDNKSSLKVAEKLCDDGYKEMHDLVRDRHVVFTKRV